MHAPRIVQCAEALRAQRHNAQRRASISPQPPAVAMHTANADADVDRSRTVSDLSRSGPILTETLNFVQNKNLERKYFEINKI